MEIVALTNEAQILKDAIDEKIENKELRTWKIVKNSKKENLYTHTPEQWLEKAMVKPLVEKDKVRFRIVWWRNVTSDEATSGYILGRFTEILMVHFNDYFHHLEINQ